MLRSFELDESGNLKDLIGATAVALVTILTVMIALLVAQPLIVMVHDMKTTIGVDESSPVYSAALYNRFDQAVNGWYILALVSCCCVIIYIPIVVLRRQRYNDEQRFR